MASAAPPAARTLSHRHESIQSDDWPEDINAPPARHGDHKQFTGDGLNTGVRVLSDGRLDININENRPSIAGILNRIQQTPAPSDLEDLAEQETPEPIPKGSGQDFPLRMNIVIQVIGSRGDIQPFVALGKELKAHGHRVRLATHLAFREFVLEGGLEFFCIGGDPEELMAFMVQNPSLLPAFRTIRSGAIQKRRREMKEIIYGCWKSCIETGDGTDLHQIKDDLWSDAVDYRRRPFVADAIIANPPSLAHIHCAQRLGIPLHMMFTMPWTPTQFFPHPLAVLHQQGCKPTVANFVSYAVVDMMIWEGLGDLVNSWRKKCLALDELDSITAPSLIHRLRVPCSYLWSPSILRKPRDWPEHIDICGFSVLPAKSDYKPPKEIEDFLNAGPTPLYVGFGSIVVDDQIKLTRIVFEAIQNSGQRAIVSKGWGNLGVDEVDVPDNILIIGSVPHDWLFTRVSCVIHHGGAGTTAAGLALGRPTIIVPFFGDQQFWGGIVAHAGAGPTPIPHKQLTVEKLTDAIEMALHQSTQERAQEISRKMQEESGVRDGVRSFHRHLNLNSLRCSICPNLPAVWHVKQTRIALSAFAATVLVETGRLKPDDVVLNRAVEYDTYRDPVGPISAGAQVLVGAIANFVTGIGELPYDMLSDIVSAGRAIGHPIHHDHTSKKCAWKKQRKRSRVSSTGSEEEEFHESPEYQPERAQGSSETMTMSTDDDTETNDFTSSSIAHERSLQLERTQSMSCAESTKPGGAIYEIRTHGSRMSKKLLKTIIWLPTDLTLSLSKGFHNAPKLYHDPMVKDMPKVIGFRSGLSAAGVEFRDGFYYGITGLVTQPRYGYQHEGAKGMVKGVGKGVCGVFFKPPAGLWGLAGYPLVGLRRKLQTSLGKIQDRQIVESRIAQGLEEMRASTADDRAEVARAWRLIEEDFNVSY
ncbi:UDP-glucuronosyl/UDP-glucosyltransferase [Penicillium bovifimosum]|uniref:UDP-glucuronosyl/UDP-glucosyltransferase n=1 Tax=Penicillium bovifimosum TaxID=126998 RepID=A0A9W9GNQ0_9EURO|nr:UDP-glucuronosyl/UDP-glucosyltransferase [Penicillium bovifimosum]KAJ5124951.1 UDP-glucuronosyl/UDP-glucosyltransferase [Penicillium bovifimosum]